MNFLNWITNKINTAYLGFFLALLVMLTLSYYSYRSFRNENQSEMRVIHTSHVLQTSNDLLSNVKDAETSVRGYVITGNIIFLEPWYNSLNKKDILFNQLKELTKDNATQQQRVKVAGDLIAQKYYIIAGAMALRREKGLQAVIAANHHNAGKKIMDSIRVVCAQISGEEQQLLEAQTGQVSADINETRLLLLVSTCASVSIFLIMFIIMHLEIKRRKETEEKLFIQKELLTQKSQLPLANTVYS
jgi:CHASE3 domain sensor protein